MTKTTIATALGIVIGGASMGANAALTSSATLNFVTQGPTTICSYGTPAAGPGDCNKPAYSSSDVIGSYFSMDANKDGTVAPAEKTGISSLNGIHFGSAQDASGSHSGSINGTESPNIDNPWEFFGNTGMHQTSASITDLTGAGATRTLDMSSWSVAWNTLDPIALVVQSNAVITCSTTSCSDSSTYTLDGAWHVNGAGFTSVNYTLHLEGHITSAAVPVPAAVWLFGSGLLGLAGVARRRKSK